MTGMIKQSTDPRSGQKPLKGPEDRIRELEALRQEVAKKKPSPGYDPAMQMQDINHEIARLKNR